MIFIVVDDDTVIPYTNFVFIHKTNVLIEIFICDIKCE